MISLKTSFLNQKKIVFLLKDKKENDMLTKTRLKKEIEKFPDKFTIDELIEKLIVIEKIQEGENQSEKGEVISENELDKEIEKWFE